MNVTSVGVELEGGILESSLFEWKRKNASKLEKLHYSHGSDGSICNAPKTHGKRIPMSYSLVELRMWTEYANLPLLFDVVRKLYEGGFVANDSCGLHVHIRMKDMNKIIALLSYEFQYNFFVGRFADKYRRSEKHMQRLKNGFCLPVYDYKTIQAQLNSPYRSCHRYTAINFNPYPKYGTIEVRLMPFAQDFVEFVDSVLFVVDTMDEIYESTLPEKLGNCDIKFSFDKSFELQTHYIPSVTDTEVVIPRLS